MSSQVFGKRMDLFVAEASNHLGINLYKALAKEETNVFFSPFSISTTLAMLFCGAENKTAEEMRKVLGYNVTNIKDEELKFCFQKFLDALGRNEKSCTLSYANALLIQKNFLVKEEYKAVLDDYFNALCQEADFLNENKKVVKFVNEFVNLKTNRMIPKCLESVDPESVMMILNAVYFKGRWLIPFEERRTSQQYFYNKGEQDNGKKVDMMGYTKMFLYAEKESYKVLELPYKGNDVAMLVLLPNSGTGLSNLESSLGPTFIQDIKSSMKEDYVFVNLPKFRLEYSKCLKNSLQTLGLNLVFKVGAHLKGISDSDELFVSAVNHTAVLEVNETGCEAMAVTYALSGGGWPPPEFIVDHPFMFAIYNTKNNTILFMGRVDEL